ncbi:N-linked glycosylation glycosyltransferase PglG [hydrothermal vent metagenome]|uniref:N-linked glycosylation glycosyltransferase PglG n=1 Tax=hydrothermal vent metagenome TaxID=652676 RepID=A0A1W1EK26_9ZZZZ
MISLVKIYQEHKKDIEDFIMNNIYNNSVGLLQSNNLEDFFKTFDSLQLFYVTDDKYQQSSPSFSRLSTDISQISKSRTYFFKKRILNEYDEYISSPYLCTKSGELIVTVIKKIENQYIVMDFNLVELLEELGFVTHAIFFNKSNKIIYGFIGYGLAFLSSILVFYAFFSFYDYFKDNISLINTSFKSIISLTLGLAVFDLGKNLLEHEVIYKDGGSHKENDRNMFIKFLISIITALSIEALMLVLKISLTKEYQDIIYAVYLIGGVSLMIISLSLFYKFSNKN